jgi:hypothetical protein
MRKTTVRKGGLLYGFYRMGSDQPDFETKKVSICKLFWHVARGMLLSLLLIIAVGIIGLLFAHCFNIKKAIYEEKTDVLTPFKSWPKIFGCRVWPISLIGVTVFAWILLTMPWRMFFDRIVVPAVTTHSSHFLIWLSCCTVGALTFFGIDRFLSSEAWRAFKDFLVATKTRVCWEVEFTDDGNATPTSSADPVQT